MILKKYYEGETMLKIKKLEVNGFRGFPQKTSIEFLNPVTILYGGNHQGKSSVLNAIEWCLYGDECIGEKSGIRERVGTGEMSWRIINDNCDTAIVKLEIEGENENFTIIRTLSNGKSKKGKTIKILLQNGTEKEGSEAEQEIKKLLRASFKDFITSVYQHQETIRDFVIQKPSEQSDAMDRLLGLSDYRNILKGINNSNISKIQKFLAEKFDRFQENLKNALKIRQGDLEEKENKAIEMGLNFDELNEDKLLELAESIINDINSFAFLIGINAKKSPLHQHGKIHLHLLKPLKMNANVFGENHLK
jgi:DNA repair exonuclease SbcCD ATPase subunit